MHLFQHILEILALQVPQDLHSRAVNFLRVADHGGRSVIHGRLTVHQLFPALLVFPAALLNKLVKRFDVVVHVLQAVVQVGELFFLRFDAAREDVLQHLREIALGA